VKRSRTYSSRQIKNEILRAEPRPFPHKNTGDLINIASAQKLVKMREKKDEAL
jgi:hypothetical protein